MLHDPVLLVQRLLQLHLHDVRAPDLRARGTTDGRQSHGRSARRRTRRRIRHVQPLRQTNLRKGRKVISISSI